MIYYITLLVLYVPIIFGYHRQNKSNVLKSAKKVDIYFVFVLIIITLLMGLKKYTVGCDTIVYKEIYQNFKIINFSTEQGFHAYNYIFNYLNFDFQQFLFCSSIIICFGTFCFFFKLSKNFYFSIFLFITIGLFTMYMSGLRQSIAISLCMIATIQILDNKKICPLFLIILAVTFHNSAIIFFIMFLFKRVHLTKLNALILIIVSSSTILFRQYIVSIVSQIGFRKYDIYDLQKGFHTNILLPIIAILIPLFCILFDNKIDEKQHFSRETSFLIIMSCFNIIFTMLSYSHAQLGRIAYYFANANMVLIPNTIFVFNKKYKGVVVLLIALICLLYFYMATPGGILQIDNYKFFWQN